MRTIFTLFIAGALTLSIAQAQDSQSLGDIARQVRQQKQQKDAQAKDSAPKTIAVTDSQNTSTTSTDSAPSASQHVITNEEIPEHTGSSESSSHRINSAKPDQASSPGDKEAQGEQWKSEIQQQKSEIASLKQEIEQLNGSIHYAGGNCVANCVKWNEHQEQKQQQVDSMKSQLEEMQRHLEEMQDSARKQGFGSSIYDP